MCVAVSVESGWWCQRSTEPGLAMASLNESSFWFPIIPINIWYFRAGAFFDTHITFVRSQVCKKRSITVALIGSRFNFYSFVGFFRNLILGVLNITSQHLQCQYSNNGNGNRSSTCSSNFCNTCSRLGNHNFRYPPNLLTYIPKLLSLFNYPPIYMPTWLRCPPDLTLIILFTTCIPLGNKVATHHSCIT